jgi:hypothetical protein
MALVIVGWLLTACALAYQGIYILRTGQTMLFFVKSVHSRAPSGVLLRVAYALLYLFPVAAITVILATALAKGGLRRVQSWVIGNLGMIFWSICFLFIGLLLLAQPEKMLRWTIRANPDLADNKSVVVITRCIGVGLLGMGIVMLAKL